MFKDDNTNDERVEIQEGGRSRRRWASRSGVALLAALLLPLLGSCLRYHNKPDFCEQDNQCPGSSCDPLTKRCVSLDGGAGGSTSSATGGSGIAGAGGGGRDGGGAGGLSTTGGVGGLSATGGAGGAPPDGGMDIVTTGCSKKADCAATPSTSICDPTSRTCVGCLAPADCSGTKSVCDTTAKACVTCLTSTDCHAPTAACDPATHACVACLAKADCFSTPATPACDMTTKTCVACLGNTDCSGMPATPVCDTMAHVCVGCVGRIDCTAPKPACDTAAKMCVGCLAKTDCASPTPTCDTTAKMCVGCLAKTDCAAPTPTCDTATKTCVGCVARTDCAAPKPACDTTAKMCVGCLARTDCAAPTPACDTAAKACVGCLATSDCGGSKPLCDTAAKSCVQCLSNTDCGGGTPICDAHVCRSCRDDADCVTNFGANPGVCMSHQDGRCATGAETIYVQAGGSCASGAPGGTNASPYCSLDPAVAALGTAKDLILVRGGVAGAGVAIAGGSKQFSIVGQVSAVVVGSSKPGIWLGSGDLYVRDLKVGPSPVIGIEADAASTLRTQHVAVTGNSTGGILLNGAAFDIRNTAVTSNGPGQDAMGTGWGGVRAINPPTSGPKELQLVTAQSNMSAGISCTGPIGGTGVLASGNTGGIEIATACMLTTCGTASATCGAQP